MSNFLCCLGSVVVVICNANVRGGKQLVTGSNRVSHVPFEYTAEDTYVGGGDVQRGPNKSVRDFDENDSIVHLVFTPRTKLGVLRLGAEWERFSFGLPDDAPLPDTLQSVSLVMGLDMQFSDSIIVRAEGQPGVYDTEFDNLGYDNFNLPFLIGGTYIYSPNLQLVLGVSVDIERKYPVIPVAGLRWKIAAQWLLEAVLPTPRLQYEMNKDLSLYVGANVKQTSYRVDRRFRERDTEYRGSITLSSPTAKCERGRDWTGRFPQLSRPPAKSATNRTETSISIAPTCATTRTAAPRTE